MCHSAQTMMLRLRRDPVFFARTILGVNPWGKQIEVLRALRDADRVAVRSGHGTGKSFIASVAALWFLYAFHPAKVITTAPTMNQVKFILWPEIRRLFSAARLPLGGAKLEERIKISDDAFAIGLTTDEPERLQGYHAENILIVLDEAPGVSPDIWDVAETLLTGSNGKFLAIGNPTRPSGLFYEAFRVNSPWRQIHISCLDSPNLNTAPDAPLPIPSLVTQRWIDHRAAEWGTDSPIWKARVMGEFPEDEMNTLIPPAWLRRAAETNPSFPVTADHEQSPRDADPATSSPPDGVGSDRDFSTLYLGVDVARHGQDDTAFVLRDANRILLTETQHGWDTMKTAGRVMQFIDEYELDPERVFIDDTGIGAGVTDRIHENGHAVTPFISASRPDDSTHFKNLRAEAFWRLRQRLHPDSPDGAFFISKRERILHEELAALSHLFDSAGRIQIAGKIALRGRLSRSPNIADALAMTFATSKTPEPTAMIL